MKKTNKSYVERLLKLQTDTIGDVLDEMGLPNQVLSCKIKGLSMDMKAAGPAFTIKGESTPGAKVFESSKDKPKPGFEMYRQMYDGCIAVLDTGGHSIGGPFGENSAVSAIARGCKGIVIDGGTRDAQELIELNFPTFVKFYTAGRIEGRWQQSGFEVPISMPGQISKVVTVNPGDYILADTDGVVVIPIQHIEQVLKDAEEVTRIEEKMRVELMDGKDREEVYKRNKRYAHIKKIK